VHRGPTNVSIPAITLFPERDRLDVKCKRKHQLQPELTDCNRRWPYHGRY